MANLISPGVSATIVEESFFIPGRVTTLPLIFIATADEKTQADGDTPALGTFEHNVYREVTSIRQSIELYGIPNYLTSEDGSPHHGDARNEYGLDALNKFLEIGNRAYVVRANVNLDDRLGSLRALWERQISDAAGFLGELIQEYLAAENDVNGLFPSNPNFKTELDDSPADRAVFNELIQEALVDTFSSYSFSSKGRTGNVNLFAEDFLTDHDDSRAAFQEVLFDTNAGFLTLGDTTSLTPGVAYGLTVELVDSTGPTLETIDITLDGADIQSFEALIDELNVALDTDGQAELVAGRLRFSTAGTGASFTIQLFDGQPSGTEPLLENLTLFAGISDPVAGRGVDPLEVYADGFGSPVTGTFLGLANIVDEEFTNNAGMSPSQAEMLLLNAGTEYAFTPEFRSHTKLGRNDQERRQEIVRALKATINNPNLGIRNPDGLNYNLVSCPGYKEVAPELLRLCQDMLDEVFALGETPFDRPPTGFNGVSAWATTQEKENNAGIAYWYPHGLSSNIDGNTIFTTSSATGLRVFAFNDRERALWWAPAGTQRGQCNHLSDIGYVSGTLGGPTAFISDDIDQGARDSLYEFPKNINPITFITGRGRLVLGQKTTSPVVSARESINVERLLRFIKRELRRGVFPFLFEPNDQITRDQVKSTVDNFLAGLLNDRALFDFATLCDETNNTPDRIDRKELWIDVALKPVRAIEFIYIPIRVVTTDADLGAIGTIAEPA